MDDNKTILAKVKLYSKHLGDLEQSKQELAKELISNMAFISVSLETVRQNLLNEGFTEVYQNGANQTGLKANSNLAVYHQLIGDYNSTVKTFVSLFKAEDKKAVKEDLGLNGFLGMAKTVRR